MYISFIFLLSATQKDSKPTCCHSRLRFLFGRHGFAQLIAQTDFFCKFVTVKCESSLGRVRHSLVYEIDVRPPHLNWRDPQDCDVVIFLWFPGQPVVWPCLQLKGWKGKCKSHCWSYYRSPLTLLLYDKNKLSWPPSCEPHQQRKLFCLLIGNGYSISERGNWSKNRDRSKSTREVQEASWPYQIHENIGCHFFILLVLLREKWGESDVAAADQRLWLAGFVQTRLTSWDSVIPTRTITFSSQ